MNLAFKVRVYLCPCNAICNILLQWTTTLENTLPYICAFLVFCGNLVLVDFTNVIWISWFAMWRLRSVWNSRQASVIKLTLPGVLCPLVLFTNYKASNLIKVPLHHLAGLRAASLSLLEVLYATGFVTFLWINNWQTLPFHKSLANYWLL